MNDLTTQKINLPANIDQLAKFVLIGRDKLASVRAEMRAIDKLDLAGEVREQKKQEATMLAGALLDAEVKIGQLTSEIPKSSGGDRKSDNFKNDNADAFDKQSKSEHDVVKQLGERNIQRFQQMAEHLEIVEQVKAEAKENEDLPTRTEVLRRIKDKEKQNRIKDERKYRNEDVTNIDVRVGDFKTVLDDIYDIDAIITDPPYPLEYINCFTDLAIYAKAHVKKDGFIAVYSGQYHLPEVIKRLSEHLTYVWTFCLYHVGKKQLVNGVNIMCGWKPVLIFSNGSKKMRFSAYDVIVSEQMEKSNHVWQQSESGVAGLIEIFSKPNDLVVDPFAGSGTFGVVSKKLGRRFIGAEING